MDTSTLAFESVADLATRLREGSINSTSLVEQLLDQRALAAAAATETDTSKAPSGMFASLSRRRSSLTMWIQK